MTIGLGVLFAGISTAGAQETIVQNDGFESGIRANIIAGFVPGEEAAAWLTSPCDGAIVAVQIGWFSDPNAPPADPTLGENIWIREAGVFPDAGAVMSCGSLPCQLEAPLLTPGALNEFRFVDEGNTIPLNVPVAMGRTFIVSLEFAEAPTIETGSVFTDGDGCRANRNAIFAPGFPYFGWVDLCSLKSDFPGDFVIRAIVNCGLSTGACCREDGACDDAVVSSVCDAGDGLYQGDGSECGSVECPQPEEACCFQPDGCLNLTVGECEMAAGFPQGPNTMCGAVECFPVGACCLPDGTCADDVPGEVCDASGGTFQGDGITCDLIDCPQPDGACCVGHGNCLEIPEADCEVVPTGRWAGPLTTCEDADLSGTADACEALCGELAQDSDLDCDVDAADFAEFVLCSQSAGELSAACRCFDTDDSDSIGVADYRMFQSAYTGEGAGCP